MVSIYTLILELWCHVTYFSMPLVYVSPTYKWALVMGARPNVLPDTSVKQEKRILEPATLDLGLKREAENHMALQPCLDLDLACSLYKMKAIFG